MRFRNCSSPASKIVLAGALILSLGAARPATAQGFAPYIDMSLTPDESAVSMASSAGVKYLTLAFLDEDGGCNIGWGGLGGTLPTDSLPNGTTILTVVQQLEAEGVTPIFSIGGASGQDPAAYCSSASALQAVYQSAVTRYGITYLDFDIEGSATANQSEITLRDQALVGLKNANPGLVISYTIPVEPTGLVAGDGLNLLTSAKSDGVSLSTVNIMTMDFGTSGTEMGSASTQAAAATESQIQSAGLSSTVGITPMIGQNDSGGEIFTLADASTVLSFAKSNSYVSRLVMWSMARDNGGCAGQTSASPTCSGVSQNTYAFADVFDGFGGNGGGTGGGSALISNGLYTITPETNLAERLDDSNGATNNGNGIQLYQSNGTNAQSWNFAVLSGGTTHYNIAVNLGPYCLDDDAGGGTTDTQAAIFPCNGDNNQNWNASSISPDGAYQFYNMGDSECLNVEGAGTSTGTKLDTESCNSNTSQRFFLNRPVPTVANGAHTLSPGCASGSSLDNPSGTLSNGHGQQIWQTESGDNNQQWNFASVGSANGVNLYNLAAYGGSYCLDDMGGSPLGLQAAIYSCEGDANQGWYAVPVYNQSYGGAGYNLVNKGNGYCLDVWQGSNANGTKVDTYTCNHSNAQFWTVH